MILVYVALLIVTDSAIGYPQRRPVIARRSKNGIDKRIQTSFANQAMDDALQRSSKQYIPIYRTSKNNEPEMNSRSDYFVTSEAGDYGQIRRSGRANNYRKYVTSDLIRPGRAKYLTSQNSDYKQTPLVSKKSDSDEMSKLSRYSPQASQYEMLSKYLNNRTDYNPKQQIVENFKQENEFRFDTSLVTFTTIEPQLQEEHIGKRYFENPFLSSVFKKNEPDLLPPIVETTPTSVKYLPPIQPNDFFSPSPEIISPNNDGVLVPVEDQPAINNNPFYDRVFSPNKTKKTVPKQPETLRFDTRDLPPLSEEQITLSSPEKDKINRHPSEQVLPNIEYLPHIDIQQDTTNFENPTRNINYPNILKEINEISHTIPMDYESEHVIIGPKSYNAVPNPKNNIIPVQNLPLEINNPEPIQIIGDLPRENVLLPPKYSLNVEHKVFENGNSDYNDDNDVLQDQFHHEAIKEMSFESVKLNNNPSSNHSHNHRRKVVRYEVPSSTTTQQPSITTHRPSTTSEPSTTTTTTTTEPSTSQTLQREMVLREIQTPQEDIEYAMLRRNDASPYLEENYYAPLNPYGIEEEYIPSNQEQYFTNYNEKPNSQENWLSFDTVNSNLADNLQIETQRMDRDSLPPQDQNSYGNKIVQQQYQFPIERSNQQAVTYEDTAISKLIDSTTINYDALNVNNIKQPREFVNPTSIIRQTQEFTYKPLQEVATTTSKSTTSNHKENNFALNNKKSASDHVNNVNKPIEYVSTTTTSYPKEFAKALKVYVDKQNSRNKQENKPVEKKMRQPKEYPKEFQQRSEVNLMNTNDYLYNQYGNQVVDGNDNNIYVQPYINNNNYTYNRGPTTEPMPVLKETKEMTVDGSFHYETLIGDQTHVYQEGYIENPGTDDEEQVIHGSYSFLGDDGKTYTVNYVADSNGFRASGDHLPTPHPIPEVIQRSIEKNIAEADKNPEILGSEQDGKVIPSFRDHNGIIDRRSNLKTTLVTNEKNGEQRAAQLIVNQRPSLTQVIQPRKDINEFSGLNINPRFDFSRPWMQMKNEMNNNRPIVQRRSDQMSYVDVYDDDYTDTVPEHSFTKIPATKNEVASNAKRTYLDNQNAIMNAIQETRTAETAPEAIQSHVIDNTNNTVKEMNNYDNLRYGGSKIPRENSNMEPTTNVNPYGKFNFAYNPVESNVENYPFYSKQYSRVQNYEATRPVYPQDQR